MIGQFFRNNLTNRSKFYKSTNKTITISNSLGATFANLDAAEQAKFLKGFCIEIRSWPTHYCREMQMLFIRDLLDSKDKDTLKEYLATAWWVED